MQDLLEQLDKLAPEKRARLASRLPPLSFSQQRLWFLDQLEPGSALYNVPSAVRLQGELNVAAFGRALEEIVRRHEALRTTFAVIEGRGVQLVSPAAALQVPLVDLAALPADSREAEVKRLAREEAARPFDLSAGPLFRAQLLRLSSSEHVCLLTMHHIVCDRWSLGILTAEIGELYQAFAAGRPHALPELPIQYADFAQWQREWLDGEVLEEQLAYWRRKLAGPLPVLQLPADRPRPALQTHRGATHPLSLPEDLVAQLKSLGRQHHCTLFMTLLAAFDALLHRYTGQEDIVVGSTVSGRNRAEVEPLIGFFVNTLVLRTDLSGDPSFAELLGRVREVCLEAYAHQDVPFEKLVEELQPERDLSRSPFFQVMLVLHNTPTPSGGSRQQPAPLRLSNVGDEITSAKFDLSINLGESGNTLGGSIEYNTDLFDPATVSRLASHFRRLLSSACSAPSAPLRRLPILADPERHALLRAALGPGPPAPRPYPSPSALFERQAALRPHAPALHSGDETVTYAELDARANRLARRLRRMGVGPEVMVGLCVERSVEMVVGLLGILKAGGVYVPLDPAYPRERLSFMLEDAGVTVLVADRPSLASLPEHGAALFLLDEQQDELSRYSPEDLDDEAEPESLAYVIYTSGSTGVPKGVGVSRASLSHLLLAAGERFGLRGEDRLPALASFAFDISLFELLGPLAWGGSVEVCGREQVLEPRRLLEAVGRATLLHAVPSLLR
ncbi:MAG TPA: condensation domain-containing protein, partial [Pyrinomonadaceae bacterium]|nr:condensation domain-containing protein [Pyrinomonadaceae bacterium]